MKQNTKRLVESALLIAMGTVLSLFPFSGPWVLGGGITICSMLPLVLLSYRYGMKWGVFSAVIYAVLQMLLGFQNVQYAQTVMQAVAIILFDYIVAFGVIGLAPIFDRFTTSRVKSLALGVPFVMLLRFACHFYTGVVIWEALWPNELGWAAPVWSLAYNASYMLPELVITTAAAVVLYRPLSRWFDEFRK